MKKVSLANLAVNVPATAPEARPRRGGGVVKLTREQVSESTSEQDRGDARVQVAFRMDKDAYKDLKRMALDEDTTVNELMLRAIDELRERRGLKKLAS